MPAYLEETRGLNDSHEELQKSGENSYEVESYKRLGLELGEK